MMKPRPMSNLAAAVTALINDITFSSTGAGGNRTIQFTVTQNDGQNSSASQTVSVTNQPPVANSQSIATDKNTSKSGKLTGSDPEGQPLTYSVTTPPSHGNLSSFDATTGSFTYAPATGYSGSDSFGFKVSDDFNTLAA
jgi:hypothetical protein